MKIKKIKLLSLRNEEHFQFYTDFKNLVETHDPISLGIEFAFNAFLPFYNDEREALDIIRKSFLTDDISMADDLRDNTFRGLCDVVTSAEHHFLAEKRAAAGRIQIVLDHYGNISRKPYDEETAAINSLLGDLEGMTDDATLLGLTDWLNELQANNVAFDTLKKDRYTQEAGKTQLRMKEVRLEVDKAYKKIAERMDALVIVNGEEAYAAFVNELNERIESYVLLLAQRKGRSASSASEDEVSDV